MARAILEKFASRAYRRPVTATELTKLVKLVELAIPNGDPFDRGIQLAVQAILVSPEFLFRVELDSRGKKIAAKASSCQRPASGSATSSWPAGCRISCGAACPMTSSGG